MLSGTPGNVPVFTAAQWGTEQVCQYITTYQPRRPMTQKEWRRLHAVLSRKKRKIPMAEAIGIFCAYGSSGSSNR